MKKWHFFWDNESFGRHIFRIQPKVKKVGGSRSRHEEVVQIENWAYLTYLNSTLFLMKKHVDGNLYP